MQLVKESATGRVGFIGVDPYGIRGHGEIIVSFSKITEPNAHLGHGYPSDDFVFVEPHQVSSYYRKKYGLV